MLLLIGMLIIVAVRGSSKSYTANTSRRERNLDHWDAETLAVYLGLDPVSGKPLPEKDTYVGNDAAVMFYAQWCKNCHSFAPLWDTIATLLHAGTTDSNLIMALFNCELDQQHSKLCQAAGVTHYPTLLFIGEGKYQTGNNSKLVNKLSSFSSNSNSKTPKRGSVLPRTVKYNGPLNLGEAVMDWIRTMQGLSTWHKWSSKGWIHWLRNKLVVIPGFHPTANRAKDKAMPVGIPSLSIGNQKESGSESNSVLKSKVKSMESKYSKLETKTKDFEQATEHAGMIIDSFLFPPVLANASHDGNKNNNDKYAHTDIFTIMTDTKAWDIQVSALDVNTDAQQKEKAVVKSCFIDMALDYCTRASSKFTNDYLTKLDQAQKGENATEYPSFAEMEKQMRQVVEEEEPYCSIISKCYKDDFASSECRPDTCPFLNDFACRYVSTSCLTPNIQNEYFKTIFEEEQTNDPKKTKDETKKTTTTTKKKASSGAWGV